MFHLELVGLFQGRYKSALIQKAICPISSNRVRSDRQKRDQKIPKAI